MLKQDWAAAVDFVSFVFKEKIMTSLFKDITAVDEEPRMMPQQSIPRTDARRLAYGSFYDAETRAAIAAVPGPTKNYPDCYREGDWPPAAKPV
jgi:hypothetical protein